MRRLLLVAAVLPLAACAAAPAPLPAAPRASGGAPGLVVHDGDTVEATGQVQVLPGRKPRFCAPAPVTAEGTAGGAPKRCDQGVDLDGFDATKVGPDGRTLLRGTLRGGVLHVSIQAAGRPEPAETFDWQVPCPAPAGGWQHGDRPDGNGLHELIYDEHPDWFRDLRVTYPDGEPSGSTEGPTPRTVFVVEIVTADRGAAERAVRARYTGNVCIVVNPGAKSLADQQRDLEKVQAVAGPLMQDPASGVYMLIGGDKVELQMVMLTPELDERLAAVRDLITANPWLRPAA
ncbi:hypothetical protein [Dactylosporangium sp. CA-139066]|uniref:hypothetical protein n=1 Tax=Dactylosporangium sp. CA-139066 TaxID=3239930 RepID=UPI003D90EE00